MEEGQPLCASAPAPVSRMGYLHLSIPALPRLLSCSVLLLCTWRKWIYFLLQQLNLANEVSGGLVFGLVEKCSVWGGGLGRCSALEKHFGKGKGEQQGWARSPGTPAALYLGQWGPGKGDHVALTLS